MEELIKTLSKNPDGIGLLMTIPALGPHLIGRLHKINPAYDVLPRLYAQDEHKEEPIPTDGTLWIDSLCMIQPQMNQAGQCQWGLLPIIFYMNQSITPKFSDLKGHVICDERNENDREVTTLVSNYVKTIMTYKAKKSGLHLT